MKVHELTNEEIQSLTEARADWGHEKYGDRDELRDGSIDMLEEIMDIQNILDRRLLWINKENKNNKEITIISKSINQLAMELTLKVKKFDKAIRENGYKVNDSNGGERIGFDYLEYCKTGADSHGDLE